MTTANKLNWSLKGWYGLPTLWFSLFVAALIFDLLGVVLNMASESMIDKQTQVETTTMDATVLIVTTIVVGIMLLIWWGLLIVPTWRRWVNAGKKQKNYIVWTCIQAGVVVLKGLALAYSLLMMPAVVNSTTGLTGVLAGTQNLYYIFIGAILVGGMSFLLWLANTIMIPRRVLESTEPTSNGEATSD